MGDKLYGGIEAGGTKFVCAAGSGPDDIRHTLNIPTTAPEETFAACRAFFDRVIDEEGPMAGLGIAAFGPVNVDAASAQYGIVGRTPKPGWPGASYLQAFSGYGVPVKVSSDVSGAALGEYLAQVRVGAGQGARSLAYVTVGTGIGAGLVAEGKVLQGTSHYEFGHIYPPRHADDPFAGRCPYHGACLEGLASGPAIMDRWGKSLSELPDDHVAHEIEAFYLAHLAVVITLTHMPEKIIYGGGVMKTPGLIDRVRRKTVELLNAYADGPSAGDMDVYIVPPGLPDVSGIAGALALARQAVENAG
ncbi:ROK family protein [Parvularcula flava]|uniref:fructokinase n=1 Tax=Aquisalinus luteolus TaxID=1566827 RepID=A0A8J3A020_9PROT|nr:ROK family protein [Aquisalinus luteolus]NHK26314.1 ROK family protein [Aquisalinus luteolus]GGH91956.1 fructokinase [Aquisalinus luteolus]